MTSSPRPGPRIDVVHHDIAVRTPEVLRVRRVTPRTVRVTLGGPGLDGFVDRSPADHVKVFFPEPDTGRLVLPRVADDGEIVWLHRDGLAHGEGDFLDKAVRGVDFLPGLPFVWVAGEAGELRPVRRYLHRELGLNRAYTDVDGFWRRGVADLDHHGPQDDEDGDAAAPADNVPAA
ncbi:siderophore-interacting protein [Streptomyces nojiriensis]|uniref:siderophore-interacting protein n=1 Tax=Streptomyces nojiriensis TaxID=66374 RepID=UPI0036682455